MITKLFKCVLTYEGFIYILKGGYNMETPIIVNGWECLACAACIVCLLSPQAIEHSFAVSGTD
mgnify:CR=1 FL=1